ncbi:MAG: hypothetical protein QW705_04025 [Zestosphaera sp.]
MSYAHAFKVLALSVIRKRQATLLLLVLLPPVLVSLTLTSSIVALKTQADALTRYYGGPSLVLSDNQVGGKCVHVGYGVLRVVGNNTMHQLPVVATESVYELNTVLAIKSLNSSVTCVSPKASISAPLLRVLNASPGVTLNVCFRDECLSICPAYLHVAGLEGVVIVEHSITQLDGGFLCIADSAEVSSLAVRSLLGELADFSNLYALLLLVVYLPLLYVVNIKVLYELRQELKVLRLQGLSIFKLSTVFTSLACMLVGLLSIYSVALSHLILYVGSVALRFLSDSLLLGPQPCLSDLAPALFMTLAEVPASYVAFRLGELNASGGS